MSTSSRCNSGAPNFNPTLVEAVQSESISMDEFSELLQSSPIIFGRNQRHAVVEISPRPGDEDMTRGRSPRSQPGTYARDGPFLDSTLIDQLKADN